MRKDLYINAFCIIRNHQINRNGNILFEIEKTPVREFLTTVYRQLGADYPKFHKMDYLTQLGWLAAEVLLQNHSFTQPGKVGMVLSNRNSSLDTDLRYYESAQHIPSPGLFVYTLPNIMIGEICIRHHFKGEHGFFIFEQFNAPFIEQYVGSLLNNNILETCICGWVELLGEQYETVLYLVQTEKGANAQPFSVKNLEHIYQQTNG